MLPSRYVLARSTTALACTSALLAPPTRQKRVTRRRGSAVTPGGPAAYSSAASGEPRGDVDEVERLLAATSTQPSHALAIPPHTSPSPQQQQVPNSSHGGSALDPSSALHFSAMHHAMSLSAATATTTRDGPTHVKMAQIERRRSKPSLAEAEFDVGLTERLLPELPRLPALHELHYGDAVVREVDRSIYFNQQQEREGGEDVRPSALSSSPSTVVIDGAPYAELSLDGDLSEGEFAAFDAEAAAAAAAAGRSAPPMEKVDREVPEVAAGSDGGEQTLAVVAAEDNEVVEAQEESDDVLSVPLGFGQSRPWFVPASGVVALEPLSPEDCAVLLRFVLHLRQQTDADLVPTLRRALLRVEAEKHNNSNGNGGDGAREASALTLADVTRYLDTAPPPVLALTESLPSAGAAPGSPSSSPAFVFHLYLENVSSQNAIGHLATFFGIPQRAFEMHSAASKMSSTALICAVAENRLRREHLLLLNTLRHPGFVLRVSTIQEVSADRYPMAAKATNGSVASVSHQLFGEIARWQPLYETEMLLRRISSDTAGGCTRQQLEHRLQALQSLGAICFCANREASLARAATDILHGFFRSALLNALQRKKAPMPLQRFLKRPNVATAQHAHHVSTDPTVRQVLKTFVQTNGNWQETVSRTPYVLRRRWINALRGLVWNTMASQRLRTKGRNVCIGDLVLKPEHRSDVHRRGILTVKAEHVMVVRTAAEADSSSLEDVFLPFLRGRYPEHLFAEESTKHPVMTRTSMLALLRAMHAPQLLLGLTDELRFVLDVRAESAPLLFRRLIVRPVAMEYTILEDKPPMHALHYDAARLLTNDRWGCAAAMLKRPLPSQPQQHLLPSSGVGGTSHLLPSSDVLERTTLGSRLRSGVLAEEFFTVPRPDDYVVLGHAHRHLSGSLALAAPHSNTADVGDRVYTVHIRAIVEHNLAGLSNLLREYFLLSGIETQSDSALQHKVHRLRRELDPETPLLTAPVYCPTCFNRDHDTQEQCAEHQFKRHRDTTRMDLAAAAVVGGSSVPIPAAPASSLASSSAAPRVAPLRMTGNSSSSSSGGDASTAMLVPSPTSCAVRLRLHLRRRNEEQRWGVHLTKLLTLVGLEDVQLIRDGDVWAAVTTSTTQNSKNGGSEGGEGDVSAEVPSLPSEAQSSPWPASWIAAAAAAAAGEVGGDVPEKGVGDVCLPRPPQQLLRFLRALCTQETVTESGADSTSSAAATVATTAAVRGSEALRDRLQHSALLHLPPNPSCLQLHRTTNTETGKVVTTGPQLLKDCPWTLKLVNGTAVASQRDVAAALLHHAAKAREVWLTFEAEVAVVPETPSTSPGGTMDALAEALRHPTHPTDRIPSSTAALAPARRHEAEMAMRSAVQHVSATTQRWLQDLPYRLTLVLAKPNRRSGQRSSSSWGLQVDGTDMTLVNFTRLMVQYMAGHSSSAGGQSSPENRTVVASLAPSESFPRNDAAMLACLAAEVLPGLEPLLNDAYRLVRINHNAVHHKAGAAAAMAAFQASIERDTTSEQHLLTLSLERKGASFRLCATTAVAGAGGVGVGGEEAPTAAYTSPSTGDAASATPQGNAAVDATLISGLGTPQCPVRPLTPAQLTRSCVTIAINRLILTEHTRNRWGLRLQYGTRRLKAVQQNRSFSFHVFAAKQSQGTRIADTLRLVPARRSSPQSHTSTAEEGGTAESGDQEGTATTTTTSSAAHVLTRSFYLYYVERVNQSVVRGHAELRQALFDAAQPPTPVTDADTSPSVPPVPALPPESLTLTVRQLPLVRLSATVRRGGVGEGSAMGPVGLKVDKDMRVLSFFARSPMARALAEAAGPLCSVHRLVQERHDEATAAATSSPLSSSGWDVVALPQLRACMEALESVRRQRLASTTTANAARTTALPQRQWAYDLDEDEAAASQHAGASKDVSRRGSAGQPSPTSAASGEGEGSGAVVALRALADAAAHTFQQLSRCSMVDGVHALQTSLLQEYALRQLATLRDDVHGGGEQGAEEDVLAGLVALKDELEAVEEQVRWEVVYAAQSNRPLRTPADLAAAFAPGVAEETIIIQQFVED